MEDHITGPRLHWCQEQQRSKNYVVKIMKICYRLTLVQKVWLKGIWDPFGVTSVNRITQQLQNMWIWLGDVAGEESVTEMWHDRFKQL